MENTKRQLKDYKGFRLFVTNGYKYTAIKEDAPPVERYDTCLTIRANDLKTLKKLITAYTETGDARKAKDLTGDADAWIIAVSCTECNGVKIMKAFGSEETIRKVLVRMAQEDRKRDPGSYDLGTEKPDEVTKEHDTLNAYAVYFDYHIDYTAMRVMDIRNAAD